MSRKPNQNTVTRPMFRPIKPVVQVRPSLPCLADDRVGDALKGLQFRVVECESGHIVSKTQLRDAAWQEQDTFTKMFPGQSFRVVKLDEFGDIDTSCGPEFRELKSENIEGNTTNITEQAIAEQAGL